MSERRAPHRPGVGRWQAGQNAFAAFLGGCALALLGCGPRVVWYGKTPARDHHVEVLSNGDGQWVKVDEREGNKSRGVGVDALAFSPSGEYLAYPSQGASGWKVEVISVSGAPLPDWSFKAYDGVGALVWSEDSHHLACAVEEKGRWKVVLDGREQPSVESIRARSLTLSARGEHLVYAADELGAVVVIADGVKSFPYAAVAHLTLSKQGKAAFIAREKNGKARVVVDGLESEPYQDVADLAFSPSGKHIAWTARKNDKWKVIKDRVESDPWDRVGPLFWSAKTEALAYASGRGKEEWAVVETTETGPFEGVMPESLTFNSQGTAVAFAARRGDSFWVVDPEGEKGPFESVELPQFVGSSSATAFVARRGAASFWVVDGKQGPVLADATGLVLSPNGRKMMLLARSGQKMELVVANIAGETCGGGRCSAVVERSVRHDVILGGTPAWSQAGEHFGYIAGNASSRLLMLMIDGRFQADIDVRELMAMLTIAPELAGSFLGDSLVLARWVKAELALGARR